MLRIADYISIRALPSFYWFNLSNTRFVNSEGCFKIGNMDLKRNDQRKMLLAGWLATLGIIPLLSMYGRSLQYWVADSIGYTAAAWCIGLALLFCFLSAAMHLKQREPPFP
jgi:hypothetical protein